MNARCTSFAIGGEQRLEDAIRAEVRKEFQANLDACADRRERKAIKQQIREEEDKRVKEKCSPQNLW